MKKHILILTVILFCSCNNDDKDLSAQNALKGRWLWVSSTGGYKGLISPDVNQKTEIEFSGSSLKTYTNGNLNQEQNFFIRTKKSIFGGLKKMIVIDKGNSITQEIYNDRSFEIIGKNLILSEECNDCYVSEYVLAPKF